MIGLAECIVAFRAIEESCMDLESAQQIARATLRALEEKETSNEIVVDSQ